MNQSAENVDYKSLLKGAYIQLKNLREKAESLEKEKNQSEPIAIIGLGCRFPGANGSEAYWQLLHEGQDVIRKVSLDKRNQGSHANTDSAGNTSDFWGGYLDKVNEFDAHFFGLSTREATHMDPQQRILLEVCWEALEDAGLTEPQLSGSRTGVFIGVSSNDYARIHTHVHTTLDAYTGTGNAFSILANRLSYIFNLHGPSMAIDTACSSSLVAIHQACQSLRNQESIMALAGGVNLILSSELQQVFGMANMLSEDGRCKTFDSRANGYVRGEGCGVIVLKRLSDALTDGDSIKAIIRGSAVNQDGHSNGLTAPNAIAQQAVIREALAKAGVTAKDISYVEAHGTGTPLGDPIEFHALQTVLMEGRTDEPFWLASAKTNIGHLESAAGVAGLIKTVLALQHQEIPAHLHLQSLNPHISLPGNKIQIPTETTLWTVKEGQKRLAGVSSFGFGGTNAHVILEEAPPSTPATALPLPYYILLLSAKQEKALTELASRYAIGLPKSAEELTAFCYSASSSRTHFPYRAALIASSTEELKVRLQAFRLGENNSKNFTNHLTVNTQHRIAFLFTGQGSQYAGMGKQLYETHPVFRQTINRCDEILQPYLETSLLEIIYPASASNSSLIDRTVYTQPALFAVAYSLAQVWKSWGIEPKVVLGHSVGEYVAACVAGVFSLEDALKLIAHRGRLMQNLPQGGGMTTVFESVEKVQPFVNAFADVVSIAAINGPKLTVMSGQTDAIAEIKLHLKAESISCKDLVVSHAFHSPLMRPVLDEFAKIAGEVTYHLPDIDLISNCTGQRIGEEIATPQYWCNHILAPVAFRQGIETLEHQGVTHYIEIGPKPVLLMMAKPEIGEEKTLLPSLRYNRPDWEQLSESLAQLYVAGIAVNWQGFYQPFSPSRVPLPSYPFQRKAYWVQNNTSADSATSVPVQAIESPNLSTSISSVTMQNPSHPSSRLQVILDSLKAILAEVLHEEAASVNEQIPFVEMGADSMVMIEAVRKIEKTYGVKLAISQLFTDLSTVSALALYLDENSVAEAVSSVQDTPPVAMVSPATPLATHLEATTPKPVAVSQAVYSRNDLSSNGTVQSDRAIYSTGEAQNSVSIPASGIERIIQQQLEVMAEQLRALGNTSYAQAATDSIPPPVNGNGQLLTAQTSAKETPSAPVLPSNTSASKPTVSIFPKRDTNKNHGLNPQQEEHLQELIARYTARTGKSKEVTQKYRKVLADNRASAGFRFSTKEMLYPIFANVSKGARIWDLDGNEYVDIAMGFGVNLFGHLPDFVSKSLDEQLKKGFHLGPQTDVTGEAARLMTELTGLDRVSFHNSGTEAIMTALRLVRTATGRKKIAMFAGSYHGHFDGTLGTAESLHTNPEAVPIAPGVSSGMVEDLLVLEYGNPVSLEIIRKHAHELAGVLVEPVQSRKPDFQPREFLQELRKLTAQKDIALIFDEMITGFRIHPGGAQAYFGIQADIATYGKIIGGGLPIGAVAGKAKYMDSFDGGMWQYGDDSFPAAETSFFAGTFCKHPLSMAAARAILSEIKRRGPAMQEELNRKAVQFAQTVNAFFQEHQVPIHVGQFGSLFYFSFTGNMDLFFYHLMEKGVYIWEGRTCFLSTAHSDQDIAFVIRKIKESVKELMNGGFLPDSGLQLSPIEQEQTFFTAKSAGISLPATEGQQQLWALAQLEEAGSIAYNITTTLQLNGNLDRNALQEALQGVVNRHEALRTTFSEDGQLQIIHSEQIIPLSYTNLSKTSTDKPDETIQNWRICLTQQAFDLTNGPLFRADLAQTGEKEFILVLTAHHTIFDGWSAGIVLQELGELYSAIRTVRQPELEQAMQYREYLAEQELKQTSEERAAHQAYWVQKYAGSVPVLELPVTFTRPAIKTYTGQSLSKKLNPTITEAAVKAGKEKGFTPFMTLFAAYTLLLHRLSGQKEVVVGIPVAGRSLNNDVSTVGYCANVLPLQSLFSEQTSVTDHLLATRKELLEGFDHQDYNLSDLINELALPRDNSRNLLVSTIFNLNPSKLDLPSLHGLEVALLPRTVRYTAYETFFDVSETEGKYVVECEYNANLFSAGAIERMLEYYEQVLAQMTLSLATLVSKLVFLPEAERSRILVEFNQTAAIFPKEKTYTTLFEEQVHRTPNAIAVHFEGETLSYRQLDQKANQVAHYLRSQYRIQPNDLVGIMAERSARMTVAILGIIKSGGAYVPVDPGFPEQRIKHIIEASGLKLLLTQEALIDKVKDCPVLTEQIDSDTIYSESTAPVTYINSPRDLMYVIFTSGSTGLPKGVAITHRSVVNLMSSMSKAPGITSTDKFLALTTISFDISVLEMFLPLVNGASVEIVSRETAQDPYLLEQVLIRKQPSLIQATPTQFKMLVEIGWLGNPDLKIMVGGERLSEDLGLKLLDRCGELWNMYGPTETTVWSTCKHIKQAHDLQTIGKPIDNTQIYILGADREVLPIGVTGEICIGGDGLAQGYFNQKALTAEKFIPNPFKPGERIYCTGDLGKWTADGEIECLGRKDEQVKIRGHRIELGEIENVLLNYEAIENAAVVARRDTEGNYYLIAYLVGKNQKPDAQAIRQYLSLYLPEYMQPAFMLSIDSLPKTANGKTDRKSLPEPDLALKEVAESFVAAASSTEKKLAAIWQEVLGKNKIGVNENFFEIGGNSLKATQVISRIRKEWNLKIELRSLFTQSTIKALAQTVSQATKTTHSTIVPVVPQPYYDVTPAQRRLWITNQFEDNQIAFNMIGRCELRGPLQVETLRKAFQTVVERHEILRTTFIDPDGEPKQVVHDAATYGFEVRHLDLRNEENAVQKAESLSRQDASLSFDLENGPLLRVVLLQMEEQVYRVFFTMHHIIADGWSLEIFINELFALYTAFIAGQTNPLPALKIQYKDYTAWWNQLVHSEHFQSHKTYWLKQFEGNIPVLELPTDLPRPVIMTRNGATLMFELDPGVSASLQQMADTNKVTLFVLLLTSVNVLLYRYSGQRDLVVGVPLGGREQAELEDQIGFYTNMIPLRSRFEAEQSFKDFLRYMQDNFMEAYEHGLYPFNQITEDLNLVPDPSHSHLFDVMVQYQHFKLLQRRQNESYGGIQIRPLEADDPTSKFDLTFAFEQVDGHMQLSIIYNTDLYQPGTIIRMKDEWMTLIERVSEDAQLTLAELKRLLLAQYDTELLSYAVLPLDEDF